MRIPLAPPVHVHRLISQYRTKEEEWNAQSLAHRRDAAAAQTASLKREEQIKRNEIELIAATMHTEQLQARVDELNDIEVVVGWSYAQSYHVAETVTPRACLAEL